MTRSVILFEDHTAQNFRPLSWSLPVYEVPCGLFNLRERVQLLVDQGEISSALHLLPRSYLVPLQSLSLDDASCVGVDRCLAADLDDVLFLSARLVPDHAALKDLINDLPRGASRADAHGLLVWRTDGDEARSALTSWRAWDLACAEQNAWSGFNAKAEPWTPGPSISGDAAVGLGHLWDLIHLIGQAIRFDAEIVTEGSSGQMPDRSTFGAVPAVPGPHVLAGGRLTSPVTLPSGVSITNAGNVWLGEGVTLSPGVVIDATDGPVIIDRNVSVLPHVYLEGPLYLGCGVRVKAGATIYGETAIGGLCRVSGEIAESQLLPYMNKQHAGFLGHAVVGGWVNLGADTTNSDLKNNYGPIKVNFGQGPIDTESRFVGLMMAEHAKSAIGTTFNTGTTVGFSSNIFAAGFPRTCLRNFTWGDGRGRRIYDVDRAIEVARIVMARRDCRFTDAHEAMFRRLAEA